MDGAGLLLIQLAALAWILSPLITTPGFPLDDAWIHQVIARNFVEHGLFRLHIDFPAPGSTSPLWTLIQALSLAVLGDHPVLASAVVNTLLFLLFGQLLLRMATESGLDRTESFLFAAVAALGGNGLWFVISGMETVSVAAIAAAVLYGWLTNSRHRPHAAWICLGLVLLIGMRPEAGGILCFILLLTSRVAHRSRSETVVVAAITVSAMGLLALAHLWATGSWLPVTFMARRWAYAGETWDLEAAARFAKGVLSSSARWQLGSRHVAVQAVLACLLVAGVVRCFGRRAWFSPTTSAPTAEPSWHLRALLAFACLHMLFYAATLPIRSHAGRYQPLTPLLLVPVAAIGLLAIARFVIARWSSPTARVGAIINASVLAICLVLAAISAHRWVRISASGIAHIERVHVQAGQWIATHVPPNVTVASFDIGAISHASHRPVLDLGGLVDPVLVSRLTDGDAASYLRDHHVGLVVLPVAPPSIPAAWNYALRLGLTNPEVVRLLVVRQFSSPLEDWVEAATSTGHAAPELILAIPEWPNQPNDP
jgi:hypothetical protein